MATRASASATDESSPITSYSATSPATASSPPPPPPLPPVRLRAGHVSSYHDAHALPRLAAVSAPAAELGVRRVLAVAARAERRAVVHLVRAVAAKPASDAVAARDAIDVVTLALAVARALGDTRTRASRQVHRPARQRRGRRVIAALDHAVACRPWRRLLGVRAVVGRGARAGGECGRDQRRKATVAAAHRRGRDHGKRGERQASSGCQQSARQPVPLARATTHTCYCKQSYSLSVGKLQFRFRN
eukprot:3879811-Prymnesium_polylepis.1